MSGSSHTDFTRRLAWLGLALGLAGIAGQYIFFQPLFRQMGFGPVSSAFGMLMFFTVLTNSMLIAAYWSSLVRPPGRIAAFFNRTGVQTALAAHIALVAIVYITALRGHVEMTLPMLTTDFVLHYLAPTLYVIWWWQLPGKRTVSYSDVPRWMAWPIFYLCFIMLTGLATGAFVYPILDVNLLGAIAVAINITLILSLLAVLCAGLVFVAKFQSTRAKSSGQVSS